MITRTGALTRFVGTQRRSSACSREPPCLVVHDVAAAVGGDGDVLVPGAYTRPLFGSSEAPFVGYAGWFHGVLVTKTAQVELRSGRV